MHYMDPKRDYVYHKVKANVAKGSLGEKVAALLLFVTDCIQFLWLIYHLPESTTEHLYRNKCKYWAVQSPCVLQNVL